MLPLLLALQVTAPQHDALRYDITLIPADTGTHLLGEVETTWRLASPDPVAVRLDSSLRVVRVLIDGRPHTRLSRTMYGRSEDDLVVPHQKPANDSIHTRIRYHGLVRRGATVGTNRRGERVFFGAGGEDGARFWLPVPVRTELDRTAASFRVQTPVAHRAVASGLLEKVDTLPYGHAVWQYHMKEPAPLASLGVASGAYHIRPLAATHCAGRCPSIELWTYGDSSGLGAVSQVGEMVELFAGRAGRYPYARLAYVEAPVGAAVAAPGLVFVPEGSLDGREPAHSTLALETARQWFGLAISPAGPGDRWLIEGLAWYLASLWVEQSGSGRLPGSDAAPDAARGARALHRLREITGDSVFFAGLARFSADRLNESASRADFVRSMSAAAGRDLERDLRQALDRAE